MSMEALAPWPRSRPLRVLICEVQATIVAREQAHALQIGTRPCTPSLTGAAQILTGLPAAGANPS